MMFFIFSQIPILYFMFYSVSRQPTAANKQISASVFSQICTTREEPFLHRVRTIVKVAFSVSPVCLPSFAIFAKPICAGSLEQS
jgi:hypothetical protein